MSAKKIAVAKWLTAFFIAACLTLAFGSTYSYADDVDETGSGRSSPVETAATDQSEASVTTTGEVVSATNEESGTTAAEPTATSTSTASGGTAESTTNTDVATASTASETSIAANVASGTTESVEGTSNEEGQVFVGATLKSEEAASATEKDQSAPASTEPESEALKTAASASNVSSVEGSKEAEQKDLTKGKQETTVTLSLPSAEYQTVYDIVFVMDSSTSTVNSNVAKNFIDSVTALLEAAIEKDATLKIGVVKFRGLAFDTIDIVSNGAYSQLVEYSEDTKNYIVGGLQFTEAELKALSSGSNLHGGLQMADEWLTADTAVADDHKYVIALTDGKNYIWNDDDGNPHVHLYAILPSLRPSIWRRPLD